MNELGKYLVFLNKDGDNQGNSGHQHEGAERNFSAESIENEKDQSVGRYLNGSRYHEVLQAKWKKDLLDYIIQYFDS